jgi:sulfatase maturation enzyme AslB (radical SAM superfamily)
MVPSATGDFRRSILNSGRKSTMGAASETVARDLVGPLDLLVVQPTPFCNLDCSYCYLPDRANTRRMTLDTLEQVFR